MSQFTPMIRQYKEIKDKYKDSILFFRLGDFYEMFFDDAVTASKILNIVLTSREAGKNERIPMCGVPYHSASIYIKKLITEGFRVAICEQVEDASVSKSLVKREVVKVITPGTVLDEDMLESKNNNYLFSLYQKGEIFGLAFVEISTGEFNISQVEGLQNIKNEIARINPSECLFNENLDNSIKDNLKMNSKLLHELNEESFENGEEFLFEFLEHNNLESYSLSNNYYYAAKAAGLIIDYINKTLMPGYNNISQINIYNPSNYMVLDTTTINNLELLGNNKKNDYSLLKTIDYTSTAMGGRLLKNVITQPLIEEEKIIERLNSVEELLKNNSERYELKKVLKKLFDLKRLISKVGHGSSNAKDLLALKRSLAILPKIKEILANFNSKYIINIHEEIETLPEITDLLERSINDDPPSSLREGNLIKEGFDKQVDQLREVKSKGKNWMTSFEKKEKERTNIKSLKVGYNKVFGYYIEVTKANLHLIPEDYIRKQTLVNAERFITPQLKEYESEITNAEEKLKEIEYNIFLKIKNEVCKVIESIQKTANNIAFLDVLLSFAEASHLNNFNRPSILKDNKIEIIQGRHPVVEFYSKELFVPNDAFFDDNTHRTLIITGPNMAGKSTYLRQIAIISIMSQVGLFVPAEKANIGIVDRIFTRVGASDNLAEGESTFMVEMNEVANIVNNATSKSLVILDEVGRGTSTYDGLSLAWAITEYIHTRIGCKSIVATHYHELTELESFFNGIVNYNVAVKEKGDKVIFLRQIVSGKSDKSYGIYVAKLAGLPQEILSRANKLLNELDSNSNIISNSDNSEFNGLNIDENEVNTLEKIKEIDLLNTSPMQALNFLYSLQKELKKE